MHNNLKRLNGALAASALAAALAACGGGGGGTDSTGSAAVSTVSGVAATGLAIANGTVSLKCAALDPSAVKTLADGSYSVDVSKSTLPCVVRVDYVDPSTGTAQKLHSLVQAAGTVNITPVTDMMVANLSSTGAAADAYDKFDVNEIRSYNAERVRTVLQMVRTALQAKGVDTTHLPEDPIGSKLQAAHGSNQGDDQDAMLDRIQEKLKEQKITLQKMEDDMKSGHETRGLTTSTGRPGDAAAGKTAFETNCQGCHGKRIPDAVNAGKIMNAIRENEGGMGALANTVTTAMADDIATYMANGAGAATGTALVAQTITFASPGNQTLGTTPPALSASASSGLPVNISSTTPAVCTVSGTTLTLVAAGACSLSADQQGDTTYNAAPTVVVNLTVASASGAVLPAQTITFASPGAQTVGASATLTATSSSGLPVTLASTTPAVCTLSGNTLTPVAAGDCTVTANQAGNSSFAAAATVTRTFAVTSAAGTVSAANGKALYASNGCGGCHGTVPASMNVLAGANNPGVIQSAINSNFGGMGKYSGLTSQNLADIAAYLATPNI
jgi:mono/diheme cytochrome c family protein